MIKKELIKLGKEAKKRVRNVSKLMTQYTKEELQVLYLLKAIEESNVPEKEKKALKKKMFGFVSFYEKAPDGKKPTYTSQLKEMTKHWAKLKPVKKAELKGKVEAFGQQTAKRDIEAEIDEIKRAAASFNKTQAGRQRIDRQYEDYEEEFLDAIIEGETEGMSENNLRALLRSGKLNHALLERALKTGKGIEGFTQGIGNLQREKK